MVVSRLYAGRQAGSGGVELSGAQQAQCAYAWQGVPEGQTVCCRAVPTLLDFCFRVGFLASVAAMCHVESWAGHHHPNSMGAAVLCCFLGCVVSGRQGCRLRTWVLPHVSMALPFCCMPCRHDSGTRGASGTARAAAATAAAGGTARGGGARTTVVALHNQQM